MPISTNLLSANAESVETSIADWTVGANCSIAQSSTVAVDGTQSLRITSTAAGDCTVTSPFASSMTQNRDNEFTYWCYTLTSGLSASASIIYKDSGGGTISTAAGSSTPLVAGQWTQVYVIGTTPASVASSLVQITCTATAGSQVFWCDEMLFDRIDLAYSGMQWGSGTTTSSSFTLTLPSFSADVDWCFAVVATGVNTTFNTLAGWTLIHSDSNAGVTGGLTTAVYHRILRSGDTNPTFTCGATSNRWAWSTVTVRTGLPHIPGSDIFADEAPVINTTAGTSVPYPSSSAPSYVTPESMSISILLAGWRSTATGATGPGLTSTPTGWTVVGQGFTSTGATARQVGCTILFQQRVSGVLTPSSPTTNVNVVSNSYHVVVYAPMISPVGRQRLIPQAARRASLY